VSPQHLQLGERLVDKQSSLIGASLNCLREQRKEGKSRRGYSHLLGGDDQVPIPSEGGGGTKVISGAKKVRNCASRRKRPK